MKALWWTVVLMACVQSAHANRDLASEKGCLACHGIDKRNAPIFPSYKEVAARYAGQKDIIDKLALKVRNGGAGSWGTTAMPANKATVSEAQARQIVVWILSLK